MTNVSFFVINYNYLLLISSLFLEYPDLKQHNEENPYSDRHEVLVLNKCFDVFKRVCEAIRNFRRRSYNGPLFQDFNGLSDDIERVLSDLDDLNSLGNRRLDLYAARLRKQIESIKEAMRTREAEEAHNEAMKAFIISAIFRINQTRDNILKTISHNPDETDIETLLAEADELNAVLDGVQVFPDQRTGYEDMYTNMRERTKRLKTRLEFYQRIELNEKGKRDMYKRLAKYMQKINFSDILSHWS